MPSYVYQCPECQESVTVMKSIHSNEEEKCKACDVVMVKKMFAPPVNFKGGGWAHKEF